MFCISVYTFRRGNFFMRRNPLGFAPFVLKNKKPQYLKILQFLKLVETVGIEPMTF